MNIMKKIPRNTIIIALCGDYRLIMRFSKLKKEKQNLFINAPKR